MPNPQPSQRLYLIVTDHDRGVFGVEGPMIDARPWMEATLRARNHQHRIVCGPTGADREELAAEYHRAQWLAGTCQRL